MEPREKNDIPIAHKALLLSRHLSSADKAVAAAILDHFNRKTGQCDPSVGRLAKLLGIGEATVKRATADLCSKHGLFKKDVHGGKSYRSSFTPQWSVFRGLVADWDARMRTGDGPARMPDEGSELIPDPDQKRSHGGIKNDLQTHSINPSKEPISSTSTSKLAGNEAEEELWKRVSAATFGLNREAQEKARTGASKADAAWRMAQGRLHKFIQGQHPSVSVILWAAIDEPMLDAATRAEVGRRGAGIAFIRDAIPGDMFAPTQSAGAHVH